MMMGNKIVDDGNYLFSEEEMKQFIKVEPKAVDFFRPFYGAYEFINRQPRYCLWLGDCTSAQIRSMPHAYKRVTAVREFRLKSKKPATNRLADTPATFEFVNMPKEEYIVIPETSSENRRYVPMGFMTPDAICSNALRLIPSATLYHFGVLTSSVHMAWMRTVAGRLKSDYRYSKDIVYNNFPWPKVSTSDEARISATAQAILDAREQEPNSSLADLYDETSMPIALRQAHRDNDAAVLALYGLSPTTPEPEIVKHLMGLYQRLTKA